MTAANTSHSNKTESHRHTECRIANLSIICRVQIEILQQNRLTKCGLVVETRASFAVTTCPDLEEERTIHSANTQKYKYWHFLGSFIIKVSYSNHHC